MKILILGAMHGNEPLGPQVVKAFEQNPIPNIDVALANPPALQKNVRFVEKDLNRSFPGSTNGSSFEDRRAAEIVELCATYDVVLDFHNTNCAGNDCSFVGQDANSELFDISSWLNLHRVIVADYDCLNKYAPNCLSIEISLSSDQNQAKVWYNRIASLAGLKSVPATTKVQKFTFVRRISLDDKTNFNLESANLQAFIPLEASLAKTLGVRSPAYPIFINDAYTPYNYGGLLNNLD
ncbi:MAG: succinylglutamate desuccinylase/aspartoacylase family protein [Candidatus Saccharibacteria bacterium]